MYLFCIQDENKICTCMYLSKLLVDTICAGQSYSTVISLSEVVSEGSMHTYSEPKEPDSNVS